MRSTPHLISPNGRPLPSTDKQTVYVFDPTDEIDILHLAFVVRTWMQAMGASITPEAFKDMPEPIKVHFSKLEYIMDADGNAMVLPPAKTD